MKNNCAKCSQPITGIDSVTCHGYCGCAFHMNCCNVTRALMNYFSTHTKNLFWMCDKCADLFNNSHLRAVTRPADEKSPFTLLSDAIDGLKSELRKISSKPALTLQSPQYNRWPTVSGSIRANKRPRELEPVVRSSSECLSGSKQLSSNVISVPVSEKPASKFWLYLSRIRPAVTNEEISAMVKANLDIDDDPDVVKLVARGTDTSNMSFVSFKVGLDPALKTKALDPATWPEGIMFRQFEDYGSQKFRRLSTVNLDSPLLTAGKSPSAVIV